MINIKKIIKDLVRMQTFQKYIIFKDKQIGIIDGNFIFINFELKKVC